jgi:Mor family transcriptional regulator
MKGYNLKEYLREKSQRNKRLYGDYKAGMTRKELAKKYNLSYQRVLQITYKEQKLELWDKIKL